MVVVAVAIGDVVVMVAVVFCTLTRIIICLVTEQATVTLDWRDPLRE